MLQRFLLSKITKAKHQLKVIKIFFSSIPIIGMRTLLPEANYATTKGRRVFQCWVCKKKGSEVVSGS